jgi:hypothetical protein
VNLTERALWALQVSLFAVTPQGLLLCGSSPNSPGGFGMLNPEDNSFVPGPPIDSAFVSASQAPYARYSFLRHSLKNLQVRDRPRGWSTGGERRLTPHPAVCSGESYLYSRRIPGLRSRPS